MKIARRKCMVNNVTLCREYIYLRELLTAAHLKYGTARIPGGYGYVHRDFVTPMLNSQTLPSADRYTL